MDKIIQESLRLLDLDPLSTRFFLASFKLGPARIPDIAKAAKIKRSTGYLLAKQLVQRGLLQQDHKKYANKVYPIEPAQLLRRISAHQRQLRRQEIELEENLPQLQAMYTSVKIQPKVTYFEGNSGLLQIWHDILSTKEEILLWTNQQTENLFFGPQSHDQFISERVRKQIPIRVLAVNNPLGRELLAGDKKVLRQTKLLPSNTNFSAETYIYDSKIAMLDYNQDTIGIIIESAPLVTQQKAQFELVWNLIKQNIL